MRVQIAAAAASMMILAFPWTADAKNVTSMDPQTMIAALQKAGYKARLDKLDDGSPTIETSADGNTVEIAMSDCKNNKSCTTGEFLGIWNCEKTLKECKAAADELNKDESPVHFIDDDETKTIIAYQYLMFDEVGISEYLFIYNLEMFSAYNSDFERKVSTK